MTTDYFASLARYNAWANARLYDACESLPEKEYRKARPSFFGSIHATLNHILVGDRIWLDRIEGIAGEMPPLDAILYDDLAPLRAAREAEDARIARLVGGLGDGALEGAVTYHNSKGDRFDTPLRYVLGHFFNHQTHHRGQVHDMLSQTGIDPPPLDLIFYLREAGIG